MLKTFLKVLFAAGILYWLLSEGKLDFNLIAISLKHPLFFVTGCLLISMQLIMGAYRLGLLLKIKSPTLKSSHLIGIQWIGQLFATVLPGAFTSDLLKIGYIKKADQNLSNSFIVFAILLDRMIGLSSLLFIAGVSSLFFFKPLVILNPMMEKIIYINIILFLISLLGMTLMFLNSKLQPLALKFIPTLRLKNVVNEIWKLKEQKNSIVLAYFISVGGHLFCIVAFGIVNYPFFEQAIKFEHLATLIPLGQLAVVLPISPGGIGVGHAAFSSLFQFIGHYNGASLYNVYWVMLLLVSLFGVFPFILKKHKA